MAMFDRTFRLIAAIAACVLGSATLDAAEIRADPSRKGRGAVLEGKIEAGDFGKVRSFILDGDSADILYLASPGGNLAEAMKIGRFVRALKLQTAIPGKFSRELEAKAAARHNLTEPRANYVCSSACFFIFVAGIYRNDDFFSSGILGIHRPYLSESDLKALSGDQAIAAANRTRATVENYLKEMGVPAKYADQMFSVSKDEVRWISKDAYQADFQGFMSELRDWVAARCDKLTDLEKKVYEEVKHKYPDQQSTAEKAVMAAYWKKYDVQLDCEREIRGQLAISAWMDARGRREGFRN